MAHAEGVHVGGPDDDAEEIRRMELTRSSWSASLHGDQELGRCDRRRDYVGRARSFLTNNPNAEGIRDTRCADSRRLPARSTRWEGSIPACKEVLATRRRGVVVSPRYGGAGHAAASWSFGRAGSQEPSARILISEDAMQDAAAASR